MTVDCSGTKSYIKNLKRGNFKMKKILATIVALCMAISMCVVASAADGASIDAKAVVAESFAKDSRILVPIVLKNADKVTGAQGMAGIELNIKFDDKQLTFVGAATELSYQVEDVMTGEMQEVKMNCTGALSPAGSTDSAKFMLDGEKAIALTGDVTLGTLVFKAAADIAEGTEVKATVTVVDACDTEKHKFGDQLAAGEVVLAKAEKAETPSESAPSTDPGTSTEPGTSAPSQAGTSTPSKAGTSTPSKAGAVKPSSTTSTTNPKTGDAGVLAVGALMVVAAGAAFVTMKKR